MCECAVHIVSYNADRFSRKFYNLNIQSFAGLRQIIGIKWSNKEKVHSVNVGFNISNIIINKTFFFVDRRNGDQNQKFSGIKIDYIYDLLSVQKNATRFFIHENFQKFNTIR